MEKQEQSSLLCPPPGAWECRPRPGDPETLQDGTGRVWASGRRGLGQAGAADWKLGETHPVTKRQRGAAVSRVPSQQEGLGPFQEPWARPVEQQQPALD